MLYGWRSDIQGHPYTPVMFKLIVDTSFSWEYFKDEQGFSYVSPSCERLTGYAPGEFLSNPRLLEEIVHPSDLESFREHLQKAPAMGTPPV